MHGPAGAPGRTSRGFTLIEILIVVMLLALLTGALLSRVRGGFGLVLRSAARSVEADLRYASQRAITTGALHRWTVDLDAQIFRLEQRSRLEEDDPDALVSHADLLALAPPAPDWQLVAVDNKAGDWRTLPDTVSIAEIWIGDDAYTEGVATVAFAPDGGADPAEIRLVDSDGYRTHVQVLAFTSEVRIDEDPDGP